MPVSSAGDAVPLEYLTDVEATAMEGNIAFLPPEVIINILMRLPVKSLIRFQCVCKSWQNLLKDPLFIADHLHHFSHRPSLLLQRPKKWNFRTFDCDFQLHEVDNAPLIDYLFFDFKTPSYVRIVGSSNGLLCVELSNYDRSPHNLLLWNPAIKELWEVPRPNDFRGKLSIGFGFSTIANDYKIVNIYGYGSCYDENEDLYKDYTDGVNGVKVYSLNTGSWKDLEFGTLKGLHMHSEAATASNGSIIWVGRKEIDESLMIVSFNVAMEAFTLIPMPVLPPWSNFIPTIYDNKVAILSYSDMGISFKSCFIDLWVIEENTYASGGGRWSWTKKYSSSPYQYPPYYLIPKNIWRNEIVCTIYLVGDVICRPEYDEEKNNARNLFLLNTATNEVKKFALEKFSSEVQMLNYVESLASVGDLDNDKNPSQHERRKKRKIVEYDSLTTLTLGL